MKKKERLNNWINSNKDVRKVYDSLNDDSSSELFNF